MVRQKYDYGVGLAKILAGFLVVLWHTQTFAVGVDNIHGGGVIASFALPCVNLFAVESGWLGISSNWRIGKYVRLWFQVVVTGFSVLCTAHLILGIPATSKDFVATFFPVLTHQYWYFTAYTAVFFLIPVVNTGLKTIDPRLLCYVCIGLAFPSVVLTILPDHDPFILNKGYSAFWLVLLYMFGATLRLSRFWDSVPSWLWFVGAVGTTIITAVQLTLVSKVPFVASLFRSQATLFKYNSLTTLIGSVCLFMGCIRLKIDAAWAQRIIRFFAPTAFGVYLIHVQPVVWRSCWFGTLKGFASLPLGIDVLAVVSFAFILFVALALVERGRIWCSNWLVCRLWK